MKRQSIADKERKWKRLIAIWRASGQTQRRFCEARGIAYWTFARWRKRVGDAARPARRRRGRRSMAAPDASSAFIALSPVRLPMTSAGPVARLRAINGAELELLSWPEADWVRDLLTGCGLREGAVGR